MHVSLKDDTRGEKYKDACEEAGQTNHRILQPTCLVAERSLIDDLPFDVFEIELGTFPTFQCLVPGRANPSGHAEQTGEAELYRQSHKPGHPGCLGPLRPR
jgi:hypothetical protein